MESQLHLLSFEVLLSLLRQRGFANRLDTIFKIQIFSDGIDLGREMLEMSETCREKYRDTWWEIVWPQPYDKTSPPQCFYVADSLRDALRLRPRTDISFWANPTETLAQYLAQTKEWFEETEELQLED
jgi:hypothetical protein